MKLIDLQSHTTFSDGLISPEKLIDLAISKNLAAIAITDHDTLEALPIALEYAKDKDIEVIPGLEMTCDDYENDLPDIHMLGLFIDHNNEELKDLVKKIKVERMNQKKSMVKKLQENGIKITYDEVEAIAPGVPSRSHIAKIVWQNNKDKFDNYEQVFEQYIRIGKKAYTRRESEVTLAQGIDAIKKAKGISILSHPYLLAEKTDHLIKTFIKFGGQGMETYYPYHINKPSLNLDEAQNSQIIAKMQEIARSNNLLESGGSDFHADTKHADLGSVKIPYSVLEALKSSRQ